MYNYMDIFCQEMYNSSTTLRYYMNKKINRILVEGPDCSGKSTLVNRIKNDLKWDSRSLHHQEGDQFYRYLREYANAENVVFDRGHISEKIYSFMWGRTKPFPNGGVDILDSLVRQKFVLILACPEIDVLERRYKKRKFQQEIKLDELDQSRNFFRLYCNKFEPLIYKSENYEELDQIMKKIKELIK